VGDARPPVLLAYKDVTSPTNQRTMIAASIPLAGVVNSAPLIFAQAASPRRQCCLLANLNSMAYDFVARQKVGGLHLNFFIVEQLPTLPPDAYEARCPWDRKRTLERWISDRVLKLSCTANDMRPLAEACGNAPERGPLGLAMSPGGACPVGVPPMSRRAIPAGPVGPGPAVGLFHGRDARDKRAASGARRPWDSRARCPCYGAMRSVCARTSAW
jgi:hypothetical protein